MVVDARVAASVVCIDGINTSSTSENNIGPASSFRDFSTRITHGCHLLWSGSQSKQVFLKQSPLCFVDLTLFLVALLSSTRGETCVDCDSDSLTYRVSFD